MKKLLQEFNNAPMITWAITTALVLLFAVVPGTAFHLDDNSAEFSTSDDAINQIKRERKEAMAARAICGENAGYRFDGNTLQCLTKRGAKTITAKVTP